MAKAILFGPFVGELYWEAARFATLLPFYKHKKYKGQDVTLIVLTREERFDLYGKYADILIPLKIEGDYQDKQPNCFRLNGLPQTEYKNIAAQFKKTYRKRFNVIEHIYPDVSKAQFVNKNQFRKNNMVFNYKPRSENYDLVKEYLPTDKPLVVLAPRFRKGFKRNWRNWPQFYDKLYNDKELMSKFNFIICGKAGEYIPDSKNRFYDMNNIKVGDKSSLVGLLLVIMQHASFCFGSQSAIPNIALLYKVEVLEFGCQRGLHTRTYNIYNSKITFIDDRRYNIEVPVIFDKLKKLLKQKENVKND